MIIFDQITEANRIEYLENLLKVTQTTLESVTEQRDRLAEALKEALAAIPDKTWVEDRLTFRKWERLIAAVKGGPQ
jgi:hypothetical protein